MEQFGKSEVSNYEKYLRHFAEFPTADIHFIMTSDELVKNVTDDADWHIFAQINKKLDTLRRRGIDILHPELKSYADYYFKEDVISLDALETAISAVLSLLRDAGVPAHQAVLHVQLYLNEKDIDEFSKKRLLKLVKDKYEQ